MGELKLNQSQILLIGGYTKAGPGTTTAGIITNTGNGAGTWTALSNPLPTALGEVEVAQITASKFLIAGGRPSRDGAATISAWILTLNVGTAVASWSRHNMGQARVIYKDNLQRCGNVSHYIALGGITNNGMASAGLPSVTDKVEVFRYVAPPNQGTSAWTQMIVTGQPTQKVYLKQGQGYHNVLHVSDTDFRVAGGATAAAEAIRDVHRLQVTSTCDATAGSVAAKGGTSTTSFIINTLTGTNQPLPAARARAASIQSTFTIAAVAYSFAIATGNDTNKFNAAPPTTIYYLDLSTNQWVTGGSSLHVGRLFGRLVQDDTTSTSVKMGTGVTPGVVSGVNTILYNTPTSTDVISSAGAVAGTAGNMSNGRVGADVQRLTGGGVTSADYAVWGTKYVGGSPVVETALADVEDF